MEDVDRYEEEPENEGNDVDTGMRITHHLLIKPLSGVLV
jgi:hypothetical protein